MRLGFLSFFGASTLLLSGLLQAETSKTSPSVGSRSASQGRASVSSNLRNNVVKSKSSASTSTGVLSATGVENLYGYLEFRPSYTSYQGEFHTENTAEVGYKLNSTMKTGYVQFFSTNLMNGSNATQGMNLLANDGFLYFKAKDIFKSSDNRLALAYQLRLITPTDRGKYSAGFRGAVRNQFLLSYSYNDFIKSELSYHPIYQGYVKSGRFDSTGTASANSYFDHQFIFNQEIHPAPKFTLYLPVIYQLTSYREFAGAANSGRWRKKVVFWPELDYEINPVHMIGVSFYSGNLSSEYGSGFDFSEGFKNGVTQLVWGINL
ncbi:MAG: hypothetical protein ACKOA8_17230 [Deltaproteobacteria bacterium]